MKKWIEAVLLAAVLASAGACAKAGDESAPPATTENEPAGDQAQLVDEDLPVQTDFEEEATAQITADNYQAELEALEKEIATQE